MELFTGGEGKSENGGATDLGGAFPDSEGASGTEIRLLKYGDSFTRGALATCSCRLLIAFSVCTAFL